MDQFNDRLRQQKTSLQRHIEKIQPWVTDKNYSDVQHKRLEEYVYSCRSIRRNRQKKKISGRAWKKPKKPGLRNNIQKLRTFW